MNTIRIGDRVIGAGNPCFIIAEAGINHNGSLEEAKRLVDCAVDIGADAVKFQKFKTEELVSKNSLKSAHVEEADSKASAFEIIKALELKDEDYMKLAQYSKQRGIIFFSSATDKESVDVLDRIGVPVFKVASCDLTNLPLLEYMAKKGKPIIMSTGMGDLKEIQKALKVIYSTGNRKVALLHCTALYPPQPGDHNLRAMTTMAKEFGVPIGYSDHSMTTSIPIAAVALGACIIEKHFTLSRDMPGPDQKASLEPDEFKEMVEGIRTVETALGSDVKAPTPGELEMRKSLRRSLVARSTLKPGDVLTDKNVAVKRPGTGIPPEELPNVLGRVAKHEIKEDELIRWEDLQE